MLKKKIAKCNRRVVNIIFSNEDNFMGGFCTVRTKTDFPLIISIINFTKIII